jgi:hypothetical protein
MLIIKQQTQVGVFCCYSVNYLRRELNTALPGEPKESNMNITANQYRRFFKKTNTNTHKQFQYYYDD